MSVELGIFLMQNNRQTGRRPRRNHTERDLVVFGRKNVDLCQTVIEIQ